MSLFVGFINEDTVYMAADARVSQNIPIIGRKYYDYCEKLAALNDEGKVWMAGVGLMGAGAEVFNELDKKFISTINDIADINNSLFRRKHLEILTKYNLTYKGAHDLPNCLTLLFGGLDAMGKPKICLVDSANEYKKQWFNETGKIVFNHIDNGEIDSYLKEKLSQLSLESIKIKDLSYVIESLKEIFSYVSKNDVGVGPLADFVKISSKEIIFKEFCRFKRFLYKIKLKLDGLLYSKIFKLHKLF